MIHRLHCCGVGLARNDQSSHSSLCHSLHWSGFIFYVLVDYCRGWLFSKGLVLFLCGLSEMNAFTKAWLECEKSTSTQSVTWGKNSTCQDQDINFSNQNRSWSSQSFPQAFHNSQGPPQSSDYEAELDAYQEDLNNKFQLLQKEQKEQNNNIQLLLGMLANIERQIEQMAQTEFDQDQSNWQQGMIDELEPDMDRLKLQRLETYFPPTWCDDEDGCPMIDPTLEMVEDLDQQKGEEIHPVLENIEDTMSELEISHPEEITTEEPLKSKSVEVIVDEQVGEKEVIFPPDHYIMNWDVEAPNPVLIFLGKYFTKVPRAKARLTLPGDEMDGSRVF